MQRRKREEVIRVKNPARMRKICRSIHVGRSTNIDAPLPRMYIPTTLPTPCKKIDENVAARVRVKSVVLSTTLAPRVHAKSFCFSPYVMRVKTSNILLLTMHILVLRTVTSICPDRTAPTFAACRSGHLWRRSERRRVYNEFTRRSVSPGGGGRGGF